MGSSRKFEKTFWISWRRRIEISRVFINTLIFGCSLSLDSCSSFVYISKKIENTQKYLSFFFFLFDLGFKYGIWFSRGCFEFATVVDRRSSFSVRVRDSYSTLVVVFFSLEFWIQSFVGEFPKRRNSRFSGSSLHSFVYLLLLLWIQALEEPF